MWPNPFASPTWRDPTSYFYTHMNSHRVYVEVIIMNMSHVPIANASRRLISGNVDMDSNAAITRSGRVQLWDPGNDLGLGLGGGTQYDRLIQINYWVSPLNGATSHRTALATCVITDVDRDGGLVNVEFKGKEVLADHGMHTAWAWPPGWAKSQIVMNAMTGFTGETLYWDYTGGVGWNVNRTYWGFDSGDNLWQKLNELIRSMGCRMHYNGEGILVMYPLVNEPRFTIDVGMLTSAPSMTFDMDNLINMVRVEGAMVPTWDGGEARIVYEAWPNPSHPFSPQSLARNGVPRVLPLIIKDDEQISSIDVAAEIAWSELSMALVQTNSATATAKVMPWLEENDVVNIVHPKLYASTFVAKWSIPLVGDGEMSLNFLSNTSLGYNGGTGVHNGASLGTPPPGPTPGKIAASKPGKSGIGYHHGPSGALSGLGATRVDPDKIKGPNWYGGGGGKGGGGKNGGKKGNKDKGKKGKNR